MPAKTLILIPCHGLEDFPTELGDADAAGLLNAFAVAFHPLAIAATGEIPLWQRADSPPEDLAETIVILPTCCESWLPHGWVDSMGESGVMIIPATADRAELARQLETAFASQPSPTELAGQIASDAAEESQRPASQATSSATAEAELDPDLLADFFAFGTAYLQVELLTRRMHYYSNLDSGPVRTEILAAAEFALAGDAEQARRRLNRGFELLHDARERFFPVEAFLIDLCLVIPRLADSLDEALSPLHPTTLLATAADWEEISQANPQLIDRLRHDWEADRVALVGGEQEERPIALLPVESVLSGFARGLATFKRLFGRTPQVWARRRFGLTALLPQILERAGLPFAFHVALDDGIYPDDEASKLRWEGADGVAVDAFSRIPLAAESATSFLRFSQRMAESMEEDIAAAAIFAHWPEISTPWLEDFHRIHRYAPVLGRFVTLESFFKDTEPPGRVFQHDSTAYFAPYLSQSVARETPNPIRRFAEAIAARHAIDRLSWLASIADLLGVPRESLVSTRDEITRLEDRLTDPDLRGEEGGRGKGGDEEVSVTGLRESIGELLAERLLAGAEREPGLLILNPLSFARRATIDWPAGWEPPAIAAPVQNAQFDTDRRQVTLDLPAAGFQWLPRNPTTQAKPADQPATVADSVLRNEFFEAHVSEATGGIAFIKAYGRAPKRLSQQLAFRFPRQRKIGEDRGGDDGYYSEMRCDSLRVTCDGPALGEIITSGRIVDQTNDQPLASFQQTTRVWRNRPHVEIEIVLEPERLPEGDPWTNYFACRFAWNDEAALLTRDLHETAQPAPEGRFDAPHFVEIAEGEMRTTIIPLNAPFHRRTGERMLDSLLIVGGQSDRSGTNHFRFVIACDEPYPLRAALEARYPPIVLETTNGPPVSGPSGWFFHVDSKNVQITSVMPVESDNAGVTALAVRLMETEGRGRVTRLACCRTPQAARIVNLIGETMAELSVEEGAVLVSLSPFEIATVRLEFRV